MNQPDPIALDQNIPKHDADCKRGQGNDAVFTVDCPRYELEMATISRGDFVYFEEEDE